MAKKNPYNLIMRQMTPWKMIKILERMRDPRRHTDGKQYIRRHSSSLGMLKMLKAREELRELWGFKAKGQGASVRAPQ